MMLAAVCVSIKDYIEINSIETGYLRKAVRKICINIGEVQFCCHILTAACVLTVSMPFFAILRKNLDVCFAYAGTLRMLSVFAASLEEYSCETVLFCCFGLVRDSCSCAVFFLRDVF